MNGLITSDEMMSLHRSAGVVELDCRALRRCGHIEGS